MITVGSPEILKPGSDILRKSSSQREPVSQSARDSPVLSLFLERLFTPQSVPLRTLDYMATSCFYHLAVSRRQKVKQKKRLDPDRPVQKPPLRVSEWVIRISEDRELVGMDRKERIKDPL